jgi:hypothetical protein
MIPMSPSRSISAWLVFGVLTLPSTIWASSIAVKRGQTKVDSAILPLVCVEIGTRGIALPIDSILFENMETHEEQTMYLTNSFNSSHPDLLTAVAPDSLSLSLPILRFKPGRYRVMSIDLVSGGASNMTLSLAEFGTFWFLVQDGCVNYIGGLEISADWNGIIRKMRGAALNNEPKRTQFATVVTLRQTAKRDVKWACDVDPGMLALPLALSQLRSN